MFRRLATNSALLSFRYLCRRRLWLAAAAVMVEWAGEPASASAAVAQGVWITSDTACELSGGWKARVGYLGAEGEDEPAVVGLTGAMVGARFELDFSHPFSAVTVEVGGVPPLPDGEAYFSGNWMGDGTGEWAQMIDGVEYALAAQYTLGGFNPGGNPDDPPEDSQWGWWEGTFSIRSIQCPATAPETSTAAMLGLAAGFAIHRRRRPA